MERKHVAQLKEKGLCLVCTRSYCKGKEHCLGTFEQFWCKDCELNKRVCSHTIAKNGEQVKINRIEPSKKTTFEEQKNLFQDSLMLTEQVSVVDLKGETRKVSIFYDTGCTNSIATNMQGIGQKIGEIENFKIGGFSDQFKVEVPNANILEINFEGSQTLSCIEVPEISPTTSLRVEIPKKWKNKFPNDVYSRSGSVDILMGSDATKLFPIERDRYQKDGVNLILFQSILTGKHLLYGCTGRVHHFWESSPPQVLKVVYIDKNAFPVKK